MSKRSTGSGSNSSEDRTNERDEEPKKAKFSFSTAKKDFGPKKGIQIKLASQKDKPNVSVNLKPPSRSVASVFGEESDEEPEEMPPEARMRMRNIGRDTPTSAGPNSYGKTKQGFCNAKKVFEKNLKEAALEVSDDKPSKPSTNKLH
ncbi:PEST proteolytic signal-containing nuclear protein-like [Planococcus citri]|uniref:PEST proteolytic signal-containing nuclear protein-like n=1 Tax=Planococcus citri TaxID=170843 RepID=UPI0031F93676